MHFLLSPAKNLDESPLNQSIPPVSQPQLLAHAQILIQQLQTLAPHEIAHLMKVSDKIARLNFERFATWHLPFTPENAKPAVFLFNGDVYGGLDAPSLTEPQLCYLQTHLCILSGLYGILRPLDLMQAYRLEMGTPFVHEGRKNLYEFWGSCITHTLNQTLAQSDNPLVINLASQEYFKAVQTDKLCAPVITPVFKENKNGVYKVVSLYAKRARGLMVRFSAQNTISQAQDLKDFDWEGYRFHAGLSNEWEWVFVRDQS